MLKKTAIDAINHVILPTIKDAEERLYWQGLANQIATSWPAFIKTCSYEHEREVKEACERAINAPAEGETPEQKEARHKRNQQLLCRDQDSLI